jgi:hypothetical protein
MGENYVDHELEMNFFCIFQFDDSSVVMYLKY